MSVLMMADPGPAGERPGPFNPGGDSRHNSRRDDAVPMNRLAA